MSDGGTGNNFGDKVLETLGTITDVTENELKSSAKEVLEQLTGSHKNDKELDRLNSADQHESALKQQRLRQELHQMVSNPNYSTPPSTSEETFDNNPLSQSFETHSMDNITPISVQQVVRKREAKDSKPIG